MSRDEIKKEKKFLNEYQEAQGIVVLNTEEELMTNDPKFSTFASLVLSQSQILRELDRFRDRFWEEKGEEIKVRIRGDIYFRGLKDESSKKLISQGGIGQKTGRSNRRQVQHQPSKTNATV